ncbi:LVIVD repeat-containing protein [Luteibaculum oceani]|uniref:Uncharacterized protein n=1 Tax=Luteibaculum oceani TaxID=1294296 RepID=A0A5C6V295_9FLAO|nr:hypothetical protein [Luteibaculum oceani]TXC78566.1 hypothetical protein FRX97_07560 [Luteibaculum oceani]
MKTSIKLLGLALSVLVLLDSCTKSDLSPDPQTQSERIQVETDRTVLRQRMDMVRRHLQSDLHKSFVPIDLEVVAEVAAPVVGGVGLAATHIQFDGNLAYVTYHEVGEGYGGALDIFDVTDPNNPVLIFQMTIADTDLHNLDIAGGALYIAGARDVLSSLYSTSITQGAVAQRWDLDGSGLPTTMTEVALPSYSANSIRYNPAGVLVSTGDVGGGSFILDPITMALVDDINVNDAKYIHGTADYLCVLAGEGADSRLLFYGASGFTAGPILNVPLTGYDVTTVGKNAIECYDDYVLVNLGDDGLLKVDRHTGNILGEYEFVDGDGIAISAVEFGDYTILAYGCDGVLILDENTGTYRLISSYKFSDNGSVNHVSTNGEVIFVASGLQGIRILKNVEKTCTLEHIQDGAVERSVWFELYHPSTSAHQAFKWESGTGSFVDNGDGTAQITGTIVSLKNPNDKWELTINLAEKKNWTQWSSLGRSYVAGPDHIPGSHKDWFYYIMDPSPTNPSTIVGLGDNAGVTKELQHKPIAYKYGFQLGMSGNVKNAQYGLSGWLSYLNSAGDRRTLDINVNVTGC